MEKYWINVIPKERVVEAVQASFMQSQGEEAHLNRMKKNDWVVFYSPREDREGTKKLQTFTALGQIADDVIYSTELSPGVKAFRRKVNYTKTKEIPLIPLIQHLSFIKNKKHWGFIFKMNLFEIPELDFQLISKAMVEGQM